LKHQRTYLPEPNEDGAPKTAFTAKEVRGMWQVVCVAEKVGKRLAAGSVL
jgi:hypothetical protein